MEETFIYNDGTYKAKGVCVTATVLTGLKRELLIAEAYNEIKGEKVDPDDSEQSAIRIAKLSLWPACKAGTKSIDIKVKAKRSPDSDKPEWKTVVLDFNKYITLPEALTTKWINCIFKLNPHWSPGYEEEVIEEEEEKKV